MLVKFTNKELQQMTKGDNQKLKLLYLTKILMRETDDQNYLTLPWLDYGVGGRRQDCSSGCRGKTNEKGNPIAE